MKIASHPIPRPTGRKILSFAILSVVLIAFAAPSSIFAQRPNVQNNNNKKGNRNQNQQGLVETVFNNRTEWRLTITPYKKWQLDKRNSQTVKPGERIKITASEETRMGIFRGNERIDHYTVQKRNRPYVIEKPGNTQPVPQPGNVTPPPQPSNVMPNQPGNVTPPQPTNVIPPQPQVMTRPNEPVTQPKPVDPATIQPIARKDAGAPAAIGSGPAQGTETAWKDSNGMASRSRHVNLSGF